MVARVSVSFWLFGGEFMYTYVVETYDSYKDLWYDGSLFSDSTPKRPMHRSVPNAILHPIVQKDGYEEAHPP